METSKIQFKETDKGIQITDRMPVNYREIGIFLAIISGLMTFFFGLVGIVYSIVFGSGYVLFRYCAWIIWRKIEIDTEKQRLTVSSMFLAKARNTKLITDKFEISQLVLNEFKQSGAQRAMIQYKNHKAHDLMLLTHQKDIEHMREKIKTVASKS